MTSACGKRQCGMTLAIAGVVALAACSGARGGQDVGGARTTTVTTVVTATVPPTAAPTPSTPETVEPSWTKTVADVGPSVARLDVLGCDARWMGSGFVVGDHLLMTANHVVQGASAITVQYDGGVTNAEVLGADPATDSALLRTDAVLPGKILALRPSLPARAQELGVLGFPLAAYELRFSKGTVSGLHQSVEVEGHDIEMIVTDSAINGGNSGGPAIDLDGGVVGLVSAKRLWVSGGSEMDPVEGQGYVVPSTDLIGNLDRWRANDPLPFESCGASQPPIDRGSTLQVTVETHTPVARDIARSLMVHGEAINLGNYQAAWQVFTPSMQRAMVSLDTWSRGLQSSYWTRLAVRDVALSGDRATVGVILMTEQDAADGRNGQTCSVWAMTYTMVNQQGGWLIDKAKASPGSPTAC